MNQTTSRTSHRLSYATSCYVVAVEQGSLLHVNTIQYIIASGAERGELPPGKLNVKTGLPLNLYFHLTLFWFSVGYCFVYFSDYFPVLRFLV